MDKHQIYETPSKFVSIDDLVNQYTEFYKDVYRTEASNIYDKIIAYHLPTVIDTLKLESNKPSIHDLMLVKSINNHTKRISDITSINFDILSNHVLTFYINRK